MSSNRLAYINHPLNNSPSKTSYKFNKSERFPNMDANEVKYESFRIFNLNTRMEDIRHHRNQANSTGFTNLRGDPKKNNPKVLKKQERGRRVQTNLRRRAFLDRPAGESDLRQPPNITGKLRVPKEHARNIPDKISPG